MGLKSWILKNKIKWHNAMLYYYLSLHDSCLDTAIKDQLQKKIMYHRDQLNNSFN